MEEQRPPDYNSPFMTWDQVPREVRAEVLRLADAGQFASDGRLRRFANAWAAPIAEQRSWEILLSAVMSLGDGSYDLVGAFRERREARTIVALGDPKTSER